MAMKTKKTKKPQELYEITNAGRAKLVRKIIDIHPVTSEANEVMALFNKLTGVTSSYDPDAGKVALFVNDAKRAEAINYFIVREIDVGKLKLHVTVFDVSDPAHIEECSARSEDVLHDAEVDYIKCIFEGSELEPAHSVLMNQIGKECDFFEFPPIGISYQDANASNPMGYRTLLVQDIVDEAFDFSDYLISTWKED